MKELYAARSAVVAAAEVASDPATHGIFAAICCFLLTPDRARAVVVLANLTRQQEAHE